jgi:hypothetical protein
MTVILDFVAARARRQKGGRAPGSSRVDRAGSSSTVRAVSTEELLRQQDWGRIHAKVTAFVHRRLKRPWPDAEDLSQTVVAEVLARPETWDPSKESLLKNLCRRAIGASRNEWTRKRTACELLLEHKDDELPDVDSEEEPADEVLDRRRIAALIVARLEARIAGDEIAVAVLDEMKERLDSPEVASPSPSQLDPKIKEARRRIQYHAHCVTEELDREIAESDPDAQEET